MKGEDEKLENNCTRMPKLMTTHCKVKKKPKLIAQPAIINGRRSLAYMKDNEVESYIPWDEAQEQVFKEDLPVMTVGF